MATKFQLNVPLTILFAKYDHGIMQKPPADHPEYGESWFYGDVVINGKTDSFYATPALNEQIQQHAPIKGKTLVICKVPGKGAAALWSIQTPGAVGIQRGLEMVNAGRAEVAPEFGTVEEMTAADHAATQPIPRVSGLRDLSIAETDAIINRYAGYMLKCAAFLGVNTKNMTHPEEAMTVSLFMEITSQIYHARKG